MSTITGKKVGSTNITAFYSSSQDINSLDVVAVDLYEIEYIEPTVYNGEEQCPKPVVRAMIDGELSTPLIENTDYELSYEDNVYDGEAKVIVTGKGNYKGTLTKTWTITKANIILDVSTLGIITIYDGTNKANPITDDNVTLVDDGTYTVKYGIEPEQYIYNTCPVIKNVSDSTTIYVQVSADHHNTIIGTYDVEIIPLTAELSWGTYVWVYDGIEHSTTCNVSNLINGDICDVTLSNNSITNIGSVEVQATGLSNSNYSLPSDGLYQTIIVSPGMFTKILGEWTPVKKVYKKVNGSWELQSITNSFSTEKKYLKKEVSQNSTDTGSSDDSNIDPTYNELITDLY